MLRVITEVEIDPKRLKQAREWSGVGSKTLAAAIGKSPSFVSKLETGITKSVDGGIFDDIVREIAGRGELVSHDVTTVTMFLEGLIDLQPEEVRPALRVIETEQFSSQAETKQHNLYFGFTPSDLQERVAS